MYCCSRSFRFKNSRIVEIRPLILLDLPSRFSVGFLEQGLRGSGLALQYPIDVAAKRFKVATQRFGLELELAAGVVPFAAAAGYGFEDQAEQNADSDSKDENAGESQGVSTHATCSEGVEACSWSTR